MANMSNINQTFGYNNQGGVIQYPYNNNLIMNTPYENYVTHAAMFSYNVNLSLEQEELIADLISTYGDEIIYITNKIFNKL